MKRLITFFFSLSFCVPVCTATDAIYQNFGTVTNAISIDATVFINRGTFTNIVTEHPYDMSNVRYFTNLGSMSASVGFRIDNTTAGMTPDTRRPLNSFYNGNSGKILAIDTELSALSFFNFLGNGFGTPSYVNVSATNIVNRGNLSVGTLGLMQIKGKNVDLSRGSVSSGQLFGVETNTFFNNFGFFGFNQNTYGVEDIYGGAGDTTLDISGQFIGGNALGYFPPFGVFSPFHFVQFRAGSQFFGGLGSVIFGQVAVPLTFPALFEAHAFVTDIQITPRGVDKQIQVVFVKTNFTDTNISANVRFGSSGFTFNPFGRTAIVEFSTPEIDPISGETVTNAFYFLDNSAEFGAIFAVTNFFNNSVRPSSYEITTLTPFEWSFGETNNTIYDPFGTLIFPGNTYEDDIVDASYAGYAAQVGRNPELSQGLTALTGFTNFFSFGLTNLESLLVFPDPTNQPGRIDINADTLDLTLARIRAEGVLTMNAKHLAPGGAFDVSAGIINADLGSTNGSMTISNIFPSHFKRVRGNVYAYSAIWNNTETNAVAGFTNNNRFHVLILDHELKADYKPTVRNLTLRSTNLVIKDNLTINRSLRFVTENLTFGGEKPDGTNNTITLTERATDIRQANLVGVKNFINESNSIFQGADDAFFGWDTASGWNSIINRGMFSATAPLFKATNFQNSGTIVADNGGSMVVEAGTADFSSGTNIADGSILISAGTLLATNSTLSTGSPDLLGQLGFGQLILNVTNLITDFTVYGGETNNAWQVTDGFILQRKPARGDLFGTEIRTIASAFQEAQHLWAGRDVGAGPNGYTNNVALGRLILDVRSTNSTLRFTGTGSSNALYVIDLNFEVGPLVDINVSINDLLKIDSNMRIYFINSNAGDKLTNAFPGRIVQVENFESLGGKTPLILRVNGLGVVAPNLDGKSLDVGAAYQVKATPAAGQVFAGWSGAANSGDAALTFEMQRGTVLQANFIRNPIDPLQGSYNGLFYDLTNGVKHESSGFMNLRLTKKGMFTGKIILGKPYPFRGSFNNSGNANVSIFRAGKTVLTLNLQLDLTNHSDQIRGTVAGDSWISTLFGDRANAGLPPVAQAGKYTMVIPASDDTNSPAGDGFGTVNVDAVGGLRLRGTLADGTQINQGVNISKHGQWPLYVPLYGGDGSILSWITFTNGFSGSFQGELSWIKKAKPGRNYQAGFTNATAVLGSHYLRPASGTRVLDIVDGKVTLSGGNLSVSLTNDVTLSSNNVVTITTGTNRLSITISLPTGLLNGSFMHPDTKKTTTIKGVVLQEQNNARGFFLGTNQSGAVILEGN